MKNKIVWLTLCLASFLTATAQNRYFTKTGHIGFYSHTSIEDINAINDQVTSFFDIATGEMVFSVLGRSFQFAKPLMQEHFNENYMESEKFPKASFEGKIADLKTCDFTNSGKYPVKVAGKLTIHGVTKDIEAAGNLTIDKDKITGESVFPINPEDYGIRIPSVVRQNIAESMKVTVQMNYQLYTAKK
ncbi:MAG: YceI family protein [Porphyromonadaceae bacterium]|nr:MAG: YceI family protein [Porphyromonadaceae bacterium]